MEIFCASCITLETRCRVLVTERRLRQVWDERKPFGVLAEEVRRLIWVNCIGSGPTLGRSDYQDPAVPEWKESTILYRERSGLAIFYRENPHRLKISESEVSSQ